jgi:hypothetical protein
MGNSRRSYVPLLLRAVSALSIGLAAIIFLWGGLFLSAIAEISRLSGELIGIALTVLFGWLGIELKKMADRLRKPTEDQGPAKE